MGRTAALALLLLAGCDKLSSEAYNSDRCPFVSGEMADATRASGKIDFGQQSTNYELCLSKWAYRFSHGNVSVRDAAEAAAIGCEDASDMYAQAYEQLKNPSVKLADIPDSVLYAQRERAKKRALFYAVAGRAGNCDLKKD